jgi:hypothetical protein
MYDNLMVTPQGTTMNSYLRNHDFMGMLSSPHEAEKRGLAPQDIFPHTCRVKIPVLNVGVSHHVPTSYPKNHIAMLSEMGDRIGTPRGDIYNVYVRWLLLPVLCIGGTTITSGYDPVRRFVDSS